MRAGRQMALSTRASLSWALSSGYDVQEEYNLQSQPPGLATMSFFSSIREFFDRSLGTKRLARVDVKERFELSGMVEQGSMSKVYWARDRQLGRMVCLKLLDKDLTAKFEARFKGWQRPTEGAICLALKHPNIVETYEYGLSTSGQHYIVMEMIEGIRLDRMIRTKSAQLRANRVKYLLHVTEGLEYVHHRGFVHRDVCPRNIMVSHADVAKLIDFGICIPIRPDSGKPRNRRPAGNDNRSDSHKPVTPYMDPGLFHRAPADPRNDLFGLGATAYEMLTGRLPWNSMEGPRSQKRDPRQFVKDLDTNTVRFLIKAIHPDVDYRFQSATEMKDSLKQVPAFKE
jgi:serine/threonine protein kinase